MKDLTLIKSMQEMWNSFPEATSKEPKRVYKDVVIIGNGPSAITTSFMLSGHWPYYNRGGHSIEYIHYRLMQEPNKSFVEQDLEPLCEGLEGRSNNPVSVFFDHLNHPDADMGFQLPALMDWVHHEDKAIDHVVLGKGLPGGAWQSMEGGTLTISLGTWMELPSMPFKEWEIQMQRSRVNYTGLKQNRAVVSNVAQYYHEYVKSNSMEKYFHNFSLVTSVRRIKDSSGEAAETSSDLECLEDCWIVEGFAVENQQHVPFCYITPHVVLATGSFDQPNILNVPGEDLPFVFHSLAELENLIQMKKLGPDSAPLLVIGAGLSAADAIITAHFFGISVVHVFRRSVDDPNLIFNRLPENMYPEYHKVHQMMQGKGHGYRCYQAYPQHKVVGFTNSGKVRIQGNESSGIISVAYAIVLVGSQPDLFFLPNRGSHLGVRQGFPINCKDNPIKINAYSHESTEEPGLYALGPLVGDNFVRFVQGGALAIANHLYHKYNSGELTAKKSDSEGKEELK